MKLATFTHAGRTRIGVVLADEIVDVAGHGGLPVTMIDVLAAGAPALEAVAVAATRAPRLPLAGVHLEAPVPRPPEFLAIGLNYADHIREAGLETPKFPVFF